MFARCARALCARRGLAAEAVGGAAARALARGAEGLARDATERIAKVKKVSKRRKFDAARELAALQRERGEVAIGAGGQPSRASRLCELGGTVFGRGEHRRTAWEGCAANITFSPPHAPLDLPEVAFISRRDVGKTRLLHSLLPRQELTKGKESASVINFYRVADTFRILDTPGYGWTKETQKVQSRWQNTVLSLARHRPNLKHIYLLSDARIAPHFTERDQSMMEFLAMHDVPFTHVITACDRVLSSPRHHSLVTAPEEERYASFMRAVHELKKSTGCEKVTTIVTSARERKGVGALMYDIVHRVTAHRSVEDLDLDNLRCEYPEDERNAGRALPGGAGGEGEEEEEEDVDPFAVLVRPPEFLPPAGVQAGFFYSPVTAARRGKRKHRPKAEKTRFRMMTEEEESALDERHPLAGSAELRKYFPTLAENYLVRNHADLNPAVKPQAERHFGMPLPMRLKMKYATPEEKEKWRKLLNKP